MSWNPPAVNQKLNLFIPDEADIKTSSFDLNTLEYFLVFVTSSLSSLQELHVSRFCWDLERLWRKQVTGVIKLILFLFQGRRRLARDATPAKKDGEEDKTQDKLKDSNKENKDVEETPENAEKKENETPLGKKSTPKQKEKKIKKQEDSDKESDEEEERQRER